MEEEKEKLEKLKYINKNITEKGYSPEELSNFILRKTGIPMNHMSFEQLKDMIEKFKDQSLEDIYQVAKTKNDEKEKKEKKEKEKEKKEKEKKVKEEKEKEKKEKKEKEKEKKEKEKKEKEQKEKEKEKKSLKLKKPLITIKGIITKKEHEEQNEESLSDLLYSNQDYDITTQPIQKNKLLELDQNNEKLIINITEPKQEKKGGLFTKSIYSYRIITPLIEKDVRRIYSDFEWLREQFVLRYPLRLVPHIIKENNLFSEDVLDKNDKEEINEEKKMKYLNNFMERLLQKKIFRTSPILYEFLELDDKKFKKYKEQLNSSKYELSITLDNLKTCKSKIHYEFKKENTKEADTFNKKYLKLNEIYQKLDKNISNIINDFQSLEKHMKDTAESFNQLSQEFNENEKNNKKLQNIFNELNKIFDQWSKSYGSQNKFFKNDFKLLFKFLNLDTQELSQIYKTYTSYKNKYEEFSIKVKKKKEELFQQKNYNNWGLAPGTESQLDSFKDNKKLAFEKMLASETFLLTEEKKRIAFTIYYMNKQYDKMVKYQSINLENYLLNLKENNKLVIGDAHTLIELFSFNSKEDKNENKDKENNQEKTKEKKEEKSEEKTEEKKEEKTEEKKEEKTEEKKEDK